MMRRQGSTARDFDKSATHERIKALDALRGLVMIIMALDHVRDFFHVDAMVGIPIDAQHSSTALFFTRWITHLCAPTFSLAAGASAFLWLQAGRTRGELSRYLALRGLWLVLLELFVVRFAYYFGWLNGPLVLTVLWALGWSMIILAGLIYLPRKLLAAAALLVIIGHELLAIPPAGLLGPGNAIWHLLHQPGPFSVAGVTVVVGYPIMPWAAVMALGYCIGPWMKWPQAERKRTLRACGVAALLVFLVVRGLNGYGDPVPWQAGAGWRSILSFLDCSKYPPSMDFLLMTLGPAMLLLASLERWRFSQRNPLIVFGRAPLFYFLCHLLLAHALAIPLAWARYGTVGFLGQPFPSMGGNSASYPAGYGYSLLVVYALWAVVVALMYVLCRVYLSRVARVRPSVPS